MLRRLLQRCSVVAVWATTLLPLNAFSGAFIGSSLIPDGVTYPSGYTGIETIVEVDVCILPGSPFALEMEASVKNSVELWNARRSSSANLRPSFLSAGSFDFESVMLHELGHCIGIGHPNLGFGAGSGLEDLTQSTRGANNSFDFSDGNDGIPGTADDQRGDDQNTHYFHTASNNPFAEPATIDASTYSNDTSFLPAGDLFAANASRQAGLLPRYGSPFTEAVMQQGVFESELQRTLTHDDVSTLRFAMSGLDRIQGSADDFDLRLRYAGIQSSSDCEINTSMDITRTGFASCSVVPKFVGQNIEIQKANIYFNPTVNWYFNDIAPCNESMILPENVWVMFSVPCQIGISSSALISDVIGDDLPQSSYDVNWVIFTYEYGPDGNGNFTGAYRKLDYSDALVNGQGYWIINTAGNAQIDVQGQYSSQIDTRLYVEANNANQYGWNMVGQPFRYPSVWADVRVVTADGSTLALAEADPVLQAGGPATPGNTSCTVSPGPLPDCSVASIAYSYDFSNGIYSEVNLQAGSVNAFSAVWVFTGQADQAIRFTMSATERSTP